MKLREVGTIILVVFALSCGAYTLIHKFKAGFIKPDNFVEEYVEDVIEDKIGLDIDLTPSENTGGFLKEIDWDRIREILDRHTTEEE